MQQPTTTSVKLGRDDLLVALEHALAHASDDETRPHLNCLRVCHKGGRVRFDATDGHRLIRYTVAIVVDLDDGEAAGGDFELLIAKRDAVIALAAIRASEVFACAPRTSTQPRGTLSVDGCTVQLRPVDAEFPSFDKVLPKPGREPAQDACLNTKYFADAIRACESVGNGFTGVRLSTGVGPAEPLTFESNGGVGRECLVVVMPMRA